VKKLLEKLKKIKHWEIYLAVAAVAVIVSIYLSTLTGKDSSADNNSVTTAQISENYADRLEQKLLSVIGSIKGAGTVSVIVITDGDGQSELAYDIDEKTVTQTGVNGQTTSTTTTAKTPLLDKSGAPIILYTNSPKITGILVVASGAGDISVKLAIARAVQTVAGENGAKIEILTGK
jgi:stage III sporulation protein AG